MPIPISDKPVQTEFPLGNPQYLTLLDQYRGLDPSLIRLSPAEASLLTGLALKTLEGMRVSGTGPAFMKLGRKIQYRLADVLSFMAANTFQNTREARTARAGGGL